MKILFNLKRILFLRLRPGANVIKNFTDVIYQLLLFAKGFVPGKLLSLV
jgi:hypothetical protein